MTAIPVIATPAIVPARAVLAGLTMIICSTIAPTVKNASTAVAWPAYQMPIAASVRNVPTILASIKRPVKTLKINAARPIAARAIAPAWAPAVCIPTINRTIVPRVKNAAPPAFASLAPRTAIAASVRNARAAPASIRPAAKM